MATSMTKKSTTRAKKATPKPVIKVAGEKRSVRERTAAKPRPKGELSPSVENVEKVIASLKRLATRATLHGMARYGIPSHNAFGVPVGKIKQLGKQLGRNHELAAALWETGWYEARMLTSFVDDPARVTPAQMDRWAKDFDSWAICDTLCFHLFDRTPHAFAKVEQWSNRKPEFVKRAAFALLASLALHDKAIGDEPFAKCLPLIEKAATDERNFVKKGVSWALRGVGRRSPSLHIAAVDLAQRLAASQDPTPRWLGRDVLRDITRPAVMRRLVARRGPRV